MLDKWTKRSNDGRTEEVSVPYDAIDTSKHSVKVTMEKLERSIAEGNISNLECIYKPVNTLQPPGSWPDFRGIDAIVSTDQYSDDVLYLHLTYVDDAQPYPKLHYVQYCLTSRTKIRETVISDFFTASFPANTANIETRCPINRFPGGGLWVTWMDYDKQAIYSATSPDEGATWENLRVVHYDSGPGSKVDAQSVPASWEGTLFHPGPTYAGSNTFAVLGTSTGQAMGFNVVEGLPSPPVNNNALRSFLPNSNGGQYIRYNIPWNVERVRFYLKRGLDCGRVGVEITQEFRDSGTSPWKKLSSYSYEYDLTLRTEQWDYPIALNLPGPLSTDQYALSNQRRMVRFKNLSGHMYLDQVSYVEDTNEQVQLEDAIIRTRGGSSNEAVVAYSVLYPADASHPSPYYVNYFRTDRSGRADMWESAENIQSHRFSDGYSSPSSWSMGVTLEEDDRGLWLTRQLTHNRSYPSLSHHSLETFLHAGQISSSGADYSNSMWTYMNSQSPRIIYNDQFMNRRRTLYTFGSAPGGGFSVFISHSEGNSQATDAHEVFLGISPDPSFSPLEYPSTKLNNDRYTPVMAFSYPSSYDLKRVGIILQNRYSGKLHVSYIEQVSTSVGIADVTKYVSELNISHDAGEASSADITILESGKYPKELAEELSRFKSILPKSYFDQHIRLISIDLGFDQGSFVYEKRMFTGILNEVKRDVSKGVSSLSISAFDFSMWLQNFHFPYYMVYANPPFEWGDFASDYLLYASRSFTDEAFVPQTPRYVKEKTEKDEDGNVIDTYYVGWMDFFGDVKADADAGVFHMGADTHMFSPEIGFGSSFVIGSFVIPESTTGSTQGLDFRVATCCDPNYVRGAEADMYMTEGTYLKFRYAATLGCYVIESYSIDTPPFLTTSHQLYQTVRLPANTIRAGVQIRIEASCYNGDVWYKIWIDGKEYSAHARFTPGEPIYNYSGGSLLPRRQAAVWNASDFEIDLDGLGIVNKDRSWYTFKTDQAVAKDLIAKAFQGIVPFYEQPFDYGEYMVALVVTPDKSAKEYVDQCASQHSARWRFNYDGKWEWISRAMSPDFVFVLRDKDIGTISHSFNSSEGLNWVEAVDSETVPRHRVSVGAPEMIMKYGIRYKEVSEEFESRDQAVRAALGGYYESSEGIETSTVETARPLVHLEPWDIIKVESDSIPNADTEYGFSKTFSVKSVAISVSSESISTSLELSSWAKGVWDEAARVYDNVGLGDEGATF